ncbi:hypothetical protein Trydic_g6259 [Trypoxylus dichotomus]
MFRLEKLLGVTVDFTNSVSSSPNTDLIAYTAGSTVVLTNISTKREQYIVNQDRKPIKSLIFPNCGKHLFICENCQSGCIKIWDIQDKPHQIGEITPDERGTRCFAISPNGDHLVTLGYNFTVNLWNWRTKTKVTGSKVSTEVHSVSFQEDGEYFVTVGNKHFKYWYFDGTSINGKSADFRGLQDVLFCQVICGKGKCRRYVYVGTKNGAIYMFNEQRIVEQLMELGISVSSIVASEKFIFIACQEAVILCCDSLTLDILYQLPKCHHLGWSLDEEVNVRYHEKDLKYPNTIALALNETTNSLISTYNDQSLYIWNLRNGYNTVTKFQSLLYHSNCIWDIKVGPSNLGDVFLTCSSDNTIRLWNRNNFTLEKIIYGDESHLINIHTPTKRGEEFGIRCMAISSDKTHFACGGRQGVVKIYRIPEMNLMSLLEEHNLEVLSLDYTPLGSPQNLLATAGRDKQIFIFDVSRNYSVIEKIDDHTTSVTTVKFGLNARGQLLFVSSSTDGFCVIRSLQWTSKKISFTIIHRISLKRVLYTFELDKDAKYLLMACQSLKILDIDSKEIVKTLKPISKAGYIFKIALHPQNKYICASCMDKSIIVYDFSTGNSLATLYSNLVTNLCFTSDCQRLIAATGDGFLFIWKSINEDFTLDSFEEDLLPTWAKKTASKNANIVLSTKSVVPKGKWASRMEKTISIKAVSTSDESEASASTPQSSHSDTNRYFDGHITIREEEIAKVESPSIFSRESGEGPQETKPPVAPPRRRHRKNAAFNSFESASSSSSSGSKMDTTEAKEIKTTHIVTKEDVKLPVAKKSSISTEKRERVSQMIGQVKEKLENINRGGQLRSSKSMSNLSNTSPPKGSWLSTYRASVGEEKNQLWKQKSTGNLARTKFYSNENLNRLENNSENKTKRDNELVKANVPNSGKRYTKKQSNPGDKSSSSRPRPRLSLPKSDLFERAQTEPEIVIKHKSSSKIIGEEKDKTVKKVPDVQRDVLPGHQRNTYQSKNIDSN